MGEKELLVDDLRLQYTGLFDVKEFFSALDKLVADRSYNKNEKKSDDYVDAKGRQINIEFRPTKAFERDFFSMVKIRVKMTDVKEVVKEKDGKKVKLHKGNILVVFDGWTSTDIEFRWHSSPIFEMLNFMFNKYIYKRPGYEGQIIDDVHYFYNGLKAHFNLYRY